MKGRKVMIGLSNIDPKYINEAEFDQVSEVKKQSSKTLILIAAACMLIGMTITAYAVNLFGIREMFRGIIQDLPETAIPYIQEENISVKAKEWSCEIVETLADDSSVIATLVVHGGDKYMIVPTDSEPDDSVSTIGIQENKTLADYAMEKGKRLLFIGASLKGVRDGDMESINASQQMENLSDNEMAIMIQTWQKVYTTDSNVICVVYAREDGNNKVEQMEIPLTLNIAPVIGDELIYHPETPDAIPGLIVNDMIITETALGYNLQMLETITDLDQRYNIMKISIDGLTYGNGGGSIKDEEENWYFEANMCQGTLEDTFTMRFYDWDKKQIGEILFHK